MDPQNAEYSPKTNNSQCWYGAEMILKWPSVRALQWISKFCKNKIVCWNFSTYGFFYSLTKNRKKFSLCVLWSLCQLASFELFGKSQNWNFAQILFWLLSEPFLVSTYSAGRGTCCFWGSIFGFSRIYPSLCVVSSWNLLHLKELLQEHILDTLDVCVGSLENFIDDSEVKRSPKNRHILAFLRL